MAGLFYFAFREIEEAPIPQNGGFFTSGSADLLLVNFLLDHGSAAARGVVGADLRLLDAVFGVARREGERPDLGAIAAVLPSVIKSVPASSMRAFVGISGVDRRRAGAPSPCRPPRLVPFSRDRRKFRPPCPFNAAEPWFRSCTEAHGGIARPADFASGELMLPTHQTVIFLLILLALQYLTMLNKGASFLPRTAFDIFGEEISWESAIVYVLGVTVAGIALGILVFHRYEEIDRWYAAMILAVMAGHVTCVLKYDDKGWREAYLHGHGKKARSIPKLGLDKDEP